MPVPAPISRSSLSKPTPIWSCKIGLLGDFDLPAQADAPMRDAIAKAFREITGQDPEFISSGWSAELTEGERFVVEQANG